MTKTKVVSGVMMVMIYDKVRDLIKQKQREFVFLNNPTSISDVIFDYSISDYSTVNLRYLIRQGILGFTVQVALFNVFLKMYLHQIPKIYRFIEILSL